MDAIQTFAPARVWSIAPARDASATRVPVFEVCKQGFRAHEVSKMSRLDASTSIVTNAGAIDAGDRARAYVFNEDGSGESGFIGVTSPQTADLKAELKAIARTNDGKANWGARRTTAMAKAATRSISSTRTAMPRMTSSR